MTRINVVPVQELSAKHLVDALTKNGNYVKRAASYLNINRSKFILLMKKFNIQPIRKRGERPNRPEWKCQNQLDFKKARNTWYKMINRCTNEKSKDYIFYGKRGICIYSDWLNSLDKFYDYCKKLPNSFKTNYTIDRINNNGNYEPLNIRFVKHKKQCNNRRSNRLYTYKNKTQTISEWAEEYNLKWIFVRDRLELGWSIGEALTIPRYGRRKS